MTHLKVLTPIITLKFVSLFAMDLIIYMMEAIVIHVDNTTQIRATCNQVGARVMGVHVVRSCVSVMHLLCNEDNFFGPLIYLIINFCTYLFQIIHFSKKCKMIRKLPRR